MWLMYNQPMPYSVFTETPTSPVLEPPPTSFDFHFNSKHARTITAPSILPSYHYHLDTWFQSSSPVTAAAETPLTTTPAAASTLIDIAGKRWSETDDGYFTAKTPDYSTTTPGSINSNGSVTLPSNTTTTNQQHNDDLMTRPFMVTPALSFMSTPSPVTPSGVTAGTKRSFPQDENTTTTSNNKRRNVEALCLYIQVAATQQRVPNAEPKRLQLETPTVDDLKHKLCTLLSLHPNQVADVIWRRKDDATTHVLPPSNNTTTTTKRSNNDVLILVDDAVVAQHLLDNALVTVSWEIKADGMVRLVLEH